MTAVEPKNGAEDPVLEGDKAASSSESKSQARVSLGSQGSRALSASLTAAISVGGLAYGGMALDERWGCSPLFVLVGAAIGGLGGFLYLVKEIMPDALPWTRSEPVEASPASEVSSGEVSSDEVRGDGQAGSQNPTSDGATGPEQADLKRHVDD
ncbi:MAG: AtpZ/AtpI family protein [Planctomycetota bacterium]